MGKWDNVEKIIKKSKTSDQKEKEKTEEGKTKELIEKERHFLTDSPEELTNDKIIQEHIKEVQDRAKNDPEGDEFKILHMRTIKGLLKLTEQKKKFKA